QFRMNLFLVFISSFIAAAHTHGDVGCGGDCLKACRRCGPLENEGEEGVNGTSVFAYGFRKAGDCKEAVCANENATLIVEGQEYKSLVCFQGKWHFGYPAFLEETSVAQCITPGDLECDDDASIKYEDGNFQCVCNPNYVDVTNSFQSPVQLCSNCGNKKLNIVLLLDISGSMAESADTFLAFLQPFIKFLQLKQAGNRMSVITASNSYEIRINWGPNSYDVSAIQTSIVSINIGGTSNLGVGMEAVKAELIQPTHENEDEEHVLIVLTDGSVHHSPPYIHEITTAAANLEALGVETYVVSSTDRYTDKLFAIANGVEANVLPIPEHPTDEVIMDVAHRLQKRVCV
ncbi:hypothetical protein PFISCL1PPCAC_27293, partial [Pristionchus fissidentatus]